LFTAAPIYSLVSAQDANVAAAATNLVGVIKVAGDCSWGLMKSALSLHANEESSKMSKAQKLMIGLFVFWMALIFATSCTVIHFDQFIKIVQGLGGGSGFNAWFGNFWLVSWFAVVKGWHATEHAILVCLCALMLRRAVRWSYRMSVGAAFVFAVLFAASDEWHQTFVPGRDGCVRDVFIDSGGAAVAALWLLARRTRGNVQ
jgi:hypothetical protein